MSDNIWVAAADNKISLVKCLIESGKFLPDSADPNGFTPIHAAASYGNIDLLRYLLQNGGNPNVQDSDGDTPLHHTESLDVAKVLVQEFNANYRLKNNDGLNVKEYFVEENEFPELIRFFTILEQTGDPSAKELTSADSDGASVSDGKLRLPDGQEIKAYLSTDDADDNSEEVKDRREKLQEIFGNSNLSEEQRDEQLRNYVVGVVSENMGKLRETTDARDERDADPSLKRRR
ncbi:hypothetical protein PICMEDRAFT_70061 [Pichia membranifaciens NRRL Y-2026]|uniref:Uncharacterized protein n=1 Tax=Pichia membranifaciens NRRL Y-2026 TaxID=763406 RepID=A0A1E3NQQ5_9ASCO|nr:hypothetical protein PICMEDRAFT_70061 [Pichia membranifaciens NRRL Y-2026]ODQ48424.1 hypothetical protein PICMEDRAFT_70061 [Pichia membranifaciens NRRL Y-2026]